MTDSDVTTPIAPQKTENKTVGTPPLPMPQIQGKFSTPPSPPKQPGTVQAPPPVAQTAPSVAPARSPQMQSSAAVPESAASVSQTEFSAGTKDLFQSFRLIIQNKRLLVSFLVVFVVGLLLGSCLFSGKPQTKVQQTPVGLTGVVPNPEPNVANMKRCGQVERGQPCIIYIVNHSRYEKYAENFFDEASRLTEVSRHSISMDNLQYAKTLIRSGQIAQIKVPAL